MTSLLVTIFILGYAIIAFETPLKINKAASSLWLGTICWTVWICFEPTQASHINQHLAKHLAEISQILFFLMGAMTIVELVDAHQGFTQIHPYTAARVPILQCARANRWDSSVGRRWQWPSSRRQQRPPASHTDVR